MMYLREQETLDQAIAIREDLNTKAQILEKCKFSKSLGNSRDLLNSIPQELRQEDSMQIATSKTHGAKSTWSALEYSH